MHNIDSVFAIYIKVNQCVLCKCLWPGFMVGIGLCKMFLHWILDIFSVQINCEMGHKFV